IIFNQILIGLFSGLVALFFLSRFDYRLLKKYAFYILLGALLVNLLVFVDGIGFTHNGATRWIVVGTFSFQPAELLKIAFVVYFAAWLSWARERVRTPRFGLLPFLILTGASAAILLKQPDTGTFMVIFAAGLAMFLVAGARFRDIASVGALAALGIAILAFMKPYLKARIMTFFNPAIDPLGASYQLQQSLIAIGSGQLFGKGFGQSVQKFNFLPEPVGDSIFAVLSEEFGFIGGVTLILLFVAFALRGLRIANVAGDGFGRYLAVGLVTLIVAQSFVNIASMVGLLPLTGIPIAFVSHGGTALLFALAEVGILLNISRSGALPVRRSA
ncbi:MAG: FtsW/RodA/SpoVE family cell cycle protein, partial [bacterium]|nr:FtsW/RodA/SpoVE family cell cycle protein [bacterium]